MRKLILPFLLISGTWMSCDKKTEDLSEINKGHNFFPLEIGKYILYDVDSTYWDDFLGQVKIIERCQVRYSVDDTFRDASGRLSYKIVVNTRKTAADPFHPSEVIYATPTENTLEYSQKNLTFLKLVFPVGNGINWNGNAMIPVTDPDYSDEYNNEKWQYTYSDFDKEFNTGNNLYEHTVTVNQIDDQLNDPDVDSSAYAYRNYANEVYAYNVGMIYREREYWTFQPKVGNSGGSGFRKGYGVIMKAVENN